MWGSLERWRGEERGVSWHPAGPAGLPANPEMGEARWRGAWQVDRRTASLLYPSPQHGGEAGSRAGISVQEGRSSPDEWLQQTESGMVK